MSKQEWNEEADGRAAAQRCHEPMLRRMKYSFLRDVRVQISIIGRIRVAADTQNASMSLP